MGLFEGPVGRWRIQGNVRAKLDAGLPGRGVLESGGSGLGHGNVAWNGCLGDDLIR
jgi:hypothetical protein